jgi:hypothetical protein
LGYPAPEVCVTIVIVNLAFINDRTFVDSKRDANNKDDEEPNAEYDAKNYIA